MTWKKYKKQLSRETVDAEMDRFLRRGGKIKVLPREEPFIRQVIGGNGKYDAFEDVLGASFLDNR